MKRAYIQCIPWCCLLLFYFGFLCYILNERIFKSWRMKMITRKLFFNSTRFIIVYNVHNILVYTSSVEFHSLIQFAGCTWIFFFHKLLWFHPATTLLNDAFQYQKLWRTSDVEDKRVSLHNKIKMISFFRMSQQNI